MRRRLVALRLVEQLEDVAVRVGEAVRRPVPDVAVDPTRAETRRLDGGDATLEGRGAPGTQRNVPETGVRGLGQLEGVAQVVAPAAQEHRLPVTRFLLHAEDVDEEA